MEKQQLLVTRQYKILQVNTVLVESAQVQLQQIEDTPLGWDFVQQAML